MSSSISHSLWSTKFFNIIRSRILLFTDYSTGSTRTLWIKLICKPLICKGRTCHPCRILVHLAPWCNFYVIFNSYFFIKLHFFYWTKIILHWSIHIIIFISFILYLFRCRIFQNLSMSSFLDNLRNFFNFRRVNIKSSIGFI